MHHKEKRPSEKMKAKTQPHNLPARSGWLQEERRLLNDMHHILQARSIFSAAAWEAANFLTSRAGLSNPPQPKPSFLSDICNAHLHIKAGTCFYVPQSAPSTATEQIRASTDLARASG